MLLQIPEPIIEIIQAKINMILVFLLSVLKEKFLVIKIAIGIIIIKRMTNNITISHPNLISSPIIQFHF